MLHSERCGVQAIESLDHGGVLILGGVVSTVESVITDGTEMSGNLSPVSRDFYFSFCI